MKKTKTGKVRKPSYHDKITPASKHWSHVNENTNVSDPKVAKILRKK